MQRVAGSISTKRGNPPASSIAAAVATAVSDTVITLSPAFSPAARSAMATAPVPKRARRYGAPSSLGEFGFECFGFRRYESTAVEHTGNRGHDPL